MCTRTIAALVTSFVLAAAGLFAGPAHAQRDPPCPLLLFRISQQNPLEKLLSPRARSRLNVRMR